MAACFFLSGVSALIYQTAWLRQFSLVFGTSELAVSAVLAAYMGGLAAGAAVAGRWLAKVRRPIFVYGLLEGGIALSALAVPLLLAGASSAYAWALGGQPEPPPAATLGQPVFYVAVGFLVLALPTALMGATLPLLTRYAVRSNRQVGPRTALLYAANTSGAVAGTVTAAFFLLPAIGLRATVLVGVALNVAVFVIAAMLARTARARSEPEPPAPIRPPAFFAQCIRPLLARGRPAAQRLRAAFREQPAWMFPLILISGANAFFYEVLWTRLLTHVLGGSIFSFATMLAAFLTGIALGGGLTAKLARDRDRAALAFAAAQIAIAVLSIGIFIAIGQWAPATRTTAQLVIYAFLVLFPATVFIGATFPLAVRIVAADERQASAATASVYAWNTAGAIAGAILAGFWLIPRFGFEGAVKLAVLVNLVLALWTVSFVAAPRRAYAAAAAGILGAALLYTPARPQAVIASTGFGIEPVGEEREVYYAVGRSATVLMTENAGKYVLRSNGLPEAGVLVKGAPPIRQTDQWLAALPLASRPDAASMLMIGFGGGVSLEGLPRSLRAIDVIELEPEVIAANRRLSGLRAADPLEDPRIHIVVNDARNALRLTSKRYDLIVSQPSHPWTAGASHLFTREFLQLAKSHLTQGGVAVQWMSAGFVDPGLLRSLAATLSAEFAHVRLYQAGGTTLFFLASDSPLDIESQLVRSGRPITDEALYYSYMGLGGANDFLVALALDDAGVRAFSAGAPLSTDDRNRMATESRSLADGLDPPALLALLAPYDPLLDPEGWVHAGELDARLDYVYIAGRLLAEGYVERATKLAPMMPDGSRRATIAGLVRRQAGQEREAREAFRVALAADPQNSAARFALLRPDLPSAAAPVPDGVEELAAPLSGSAAAVVRGWSHALLERWPMLADLDAELAASNVTDVWFPEAMQLRADWRIRVQGQPRYVADAIRLLDRALVIRSESDLLMLRAEAALSLQDNDALIESARAAARLLDARVSAMERARGGDAAELDLVRREIRAWRMTLDGVSADSYRARDVDRVLEGVLHRASVLAARVGR